MDHQNQQHGGEIVEKKKRVTFWSPEEMITPQIIHSEPDHPALHHPSIQQNAEIRNHQSSYPSYNNASEASNKYNSSSGGGGGSVNRNGATSNSGESSSPQKKPKKEIDSTKPYKCGQCEYSFNRRDHLTRHALVHSKLKPYHCNFCSKDFTRNDHLRRHQQRVHGEEVAAASLTDISQRFVCQECKSIFSSSGHLRAHIENKHHSDFSDFLTQSSDDPLRKNASQNLSYVIVDGKKRPVCHLCNKSFAKKDHLTRHINSLHNNSTASSTSAFESFTPEQSFNCQMCGKRFSRPEFLRRHIDDVHSHASQMDILNQLNPNNSYNIHQGGGGGGGQGNSSHHHENGPHGGMFVPPPPHLTGGFFGFENNPMSAAGASSAGAAGHGGGSKVSNNKSSPLKEHKCSICNKNFSRKYHLTRHQKSLHGGTFNN